MIVVGLDLGQTKDYTALAVCRRKTVSPSKWEIPWLERLKLGTSYVEVVDHVVKLLNRPELERCWLAVDRTGCGQAVVDMLASKLPEGKWIRLRPICLTSGNAVTADGKGGFNVPKRDVI